MSKRLKMIHIKRTACMPAWQSLIR